MNRADKLRSISNRLTLLAEVCNAAVSIDGPALDGMAEILITLLKEVADLEEEVGHG